MIHFLLHILPVLAVLPFVMLLDVGTGGGGGGSSGSPKTKITNMSDSKNKITTTTNAAYRNSNNTNSPITRTVTALGQGASLTNNSDNRVTYNYAPAGFAAPTDATALTTGGGDTVPTVAAATSKWDWNKIALYVAIAAGVVAVIQFFRKRGN